MSDAFQDQVLDCAGCKTQFLFTAGEQEFYGSKGFATPKRCKPCREIAKANRGSTGNTNGIRSVPAPIPQQMERPGGGGNSKGKGRRNRDEDDDRGNHFTKRILSRYDE